MSESFGATSRPLARELMEMTEEWKEWASIYLTSK
jgi:hypothetical protein